MPRRLDQVLAAHGYGSRSVAKELIHEGRVQVGGSMAEDPGAKAEPWEVLLDGQPLDHPHGIFIRFHKPVGYVCSHDAREGARIYDLLPARWLDRNPRPASVGRLDKDSAGLVLITDQLPLIHRLTSPRHKVDKVYEVQLSRPCPPEAVESFASGSLLLEGERDPCAPAQLQILGDARAVVTLTEGRFRQVRRMFAHLGVEVLALTRTRFGPWSIEGLQEGAWADADPSAAG